MPALIGTRRQLIAAPAILLQALPPWVPAGSLAFYDFQNDQAYSNGLVLPNSTASLTISRASIGYDLAATTQFAANVARRTGAGLLVEAARTNLIVQSNGFATASWGVINGASGAQNAAGTAPDGVGASYTLSSSTGAIRQTQVPFPNNTSGAFFVFVKKSASGAAANVRLSTNNTAAWNTGISVKVALTSSWQLAAAVGVIQSGGSQANLNIGALDVSGAADATCSGNVDIAFAQFEQGVGQSSYIPTTTSSATRAADNITLTLPTGTTKVDLAYDNTTTNTVTVSAGSYTIPANPAGTNLKSLRAY